MKHLLITETTPKKGRPRKVLLGDYTKEFPVYPPRKLSSTLSPKAKGEMGIGHPEYWKENITTADGQITTQLLNEEESMKLLNETFQEVINEHLERNPPHFNQWKSAITILVILAGLVVFTINK